MGCTLYPYRVYSKYSEPSKGRMAMNSGVFRAPGAIIALAALAAATGLSVLAHEGASGVVKQRMEAMKAISRSQKQIIAMIRAERPFNAAKVAAAARGIEQHATQMPQLFPEGSHHGVSEASPDIWQEWEGFVALSEQLRRRARALRAKAEVATGAEDIRSELLALGKACKSCHSDFRVSKE